MKKNDERKWKSKCHGQEQFDEEMWIPNYVVKGVTIEGGW